ncbi:hypothetical protein CRM22_000342 [Opisthorchis felineus]|uniref:Uncharacterized protein n=1 Tax=Opisthorchis felineus TaxID=147828 RepID=A0A4S2MFT3_OPIFE|nr:hypothetical protein CRM22_000342 [Opisthorchis felineus]
MSKSRTRTEKAKPQPLTIFPEKITQASWINFLDAEESEDLASQICSELLDCTLNEIFKVYIQNQVIPYTVYQAEQALLQLLELEFFTNASSELDIFQSASWQQDQVAQACKIDSWAQGAISKRAETEWSEKLDQNSSRSGDAEPTNEETVAKQIPCEPANRKPVRKKTRVKVQKAKNPTEVQKKNIRSDRKSQGIERRSFTSACNKRDQRTEPLVSRATQNALDGIPDKKNEGLRLKAEEIRRKELSLTRQFIKEGASASGRFVFDDEGNLISVPNITKSASQPNGPRKTRKTNSYFDRTVALRYHVMPVVENEIPDSDVRIAPQPISSKPPRENFRRNTIGQGGRFEMVNATSSGLHNVSDLIELAPGVSISDGEKWRTGQNPFEESSTDGDKRLWNLKEVQCLHPPGGSLTNNKCLPSEHAVHMSSVTVTSQ